MSLELITITQDNASCQEGKKKQCSLCKETKSLSEFQRDKIKGERASGAVWVRLRWSSRCKTCVAAVCKQWVKDNPRRNREQQAKYRSTTGRERMLRSKYGISGEEYKKLLREQGGKCACCGTGSPGGKHHAFHVDHCHQSGRVRGLLCHNCNTGIGLLGDGLQGINKALTYLETHYGT